MLNLDNYSKLEIICSPILSKVSEQIKQEKQEELYRMQEEGLKKITNSAQEIERELKNWF